VCGTLGGNIYHLTGRQKPTTSPKSVEIVKDQEVAELWQVPKRDFEEQIVKGTVNC